MRISKIVWRRLFLVLVGATFVGIPLFSIEFYLGLRGTPELVDRWVKLATRCRATIEGGTPFDSTGLSEHTDDNDHYWLDDRYSLQVVLKGVDRGGFRGCSITRLNKLPVASVRIAELLLAYMKIRNTSIMTGNYVPFEIVELPEMVSSAFDTRPADKSHCVVRNALLAHPDNYEVEWLVGAVPNVDGSPCT